MAVAATTKLSQKNDDRENRYGKYEYQPLKIIVLEPSSKMQNHDDCCNSVEGVEKHLSPVLTRRHMGHGDDNT